jgi:preprotein translocase subunit SecA
MNTQREVIYAQRQKVLAGEDLRESILGMLRGVVDSTVADILSQEGGVAGEAAVKQLGAAFEGVYFPKGSFTPSAENLTTQELADEIYALAEQTYCQKEQAYTEPMMRELERVVMLRVVDEYWMDNIDAMEDLKQGIGLRAYGQHDPVVAYKEEGYEMFEAMITAIREETVRRMFLVQLKPRQEVKRQKVAKEVAASGAPDKTVKRQPVRATNKVGHNDPCPCGSGKKYKKCCMQKEKESSMEN